MQRSIFLGLVAAGLIMVAAAGGYWWMKQNRPDQQWVPMPLNPSSSVEERAQLQEELLAYLKTEDALRRVVKDLSLQQRWNVPSEKDAIDQLKSSMFVRTGEFRNPMTQETLPTVDIGVNGKRKERVLMGEIAMRLGKETRKHLGIEEKP
jgi:hypothetical protein